MGTSTAWGILRVNIFQRGPLGRAIILSQNLLKGIGFIWVACRPNADEINVFSFFFSFKKQNFESITLVENWLCYTRIWISGFWLGCVPAWI